MSSPSRLFSIVDQSISLKLIFARHSVEGVTSVRMRLLRGCIIEGIIQTNLCAKQLDITSFELRDLQMHKKDTKETHSFPESGYTYKYIYPDPEKQVSVIAKNLDKLQPSTFGIREFTKKIVQQENTGYLQIRILPKKTVKDKIIDLFDKGYELYYTSKISFKTVEPIGGSQFLMGLEGEEYFIKDNKPCYARTVFPCLDYIDDYYKISTLRVATDKPEFDVICIGNKIERGIIDGLKVTDFEINKTLSVNFLGLIVAKIYKFEFPLEEAPNKKLEIFCQSKEIVYRLERVADSFSIFLSKLQQFEKAQLKLDKPLSPNLTWVILDNQLSYDIMKIAELDFSYRYDSLFFYDTMVLDSSLLIDPKCKDTNLFAKCDIVKQFASVIHLWKLALKGFGDYWLYFGICSFIADIYLMVFHSDMLSMMIQEKKRKIYYRMVREGKDVIPLMKPSIMHPAELFFDSCYLIKSNLIFSMIFSFIKLRKSEVGDLAGILLKDDFFDADSSKVLYTNSNKIFKRIKLTFGIKNLRHHLHQYLYNTGIAELDVAYSYNRKENKMKVSIRQTPLHLSYYKKAMEERFKLERYFNAISPIQQVFGEFETTLMGLAQQSDGYISHESVKSFLEDDGRLLVNSAYCSMKYLSGTFDVIITETNEIEFREDIYEIKIDEAQDQEIPLYMRAKFRRVVQKKGYTQDSLDYADDVTEGEKNQSHEDAMVGGAPYLWIKLDPYNNYLRKIVIQDGENILLAQLEKDMKDQSDLPSIYRILQNLTGTSTQAGVNKLCSYIMSKKTTISEFLKLEMVNTLVRLKLKGAENRIYDILLSLVKKIKFEDDHSLKPNSFSEGSQYYLLNHLIAKIFVYERRIKKMKEDKKGSSSTQIKLSTQTDENVVSLLLNLLQKNDNSYNKYNDLYYQSNILRSLFKCLNLANFAQILTEVSRFLRIEFYTKYDYKYLLKVILEGFVDFVANHFEHLGISLASTSISIYRNPALNRFPGLMETLEMLKKLTKRHRNDAVLADSIFKMKIQIKRRISDLKPWELLIWGLKYIEKTKKIANKIVVSKVVGALCSHVETYSREFREMQMPLSIQNQRLLNSLIFETVTSPYSFVDFRFKCSTLDLYRLIYNDFLPICHSQAFPNHTFPLDPNWLSFKYQLNYEKSVSNLQKMITLNFLNLQKRKKAISGPMGPAEGSSKYNLRDLILQNFRFNKEVITWRNLCKQVINVLMGEKNTTRIEADIEDEVVLLKNEGRAVPEKVSML